MHEPETEQRETAELSDYIRVIRERAWVIAVVVIVAVAATVGTSLSSTPMYQASARLLYQKNNLDQALFGAQLYTWTDRQREVQTGAELVKLESVAEAVAAQLGSSKSADSLLGMVSVEAMADTDVVDVKAVGADPAEASAVANAFAEQFVLFRQSTDRATVAAARELVKAQLDTLDPADAASEYDLMLREKYESLRILESMQNGGFTVVQRASPPSAAFSPRPARNAILALVVGLVVGVGLAFLIDYLDRRIKDEKTMERELGFPVLAGIPSVGRWDEGRSGRHYDRSTRPVGFANYPDLLEAFRTLRSGLQYYDPEKRHHVWLVTSGLPREGKTITTVNLALSLSLSGKRVIVLEADLRRPMVHEYLGLSSESGLSNVLAGTKKIEEVLRRVQADQFLPVEGRRRPGERATGLLQRSLYVVTSGPLPPNPAELLASDRMAKLVRELAGMADCMLIDTPPILVVSDALEVAREADGVIFATRLGTTTRDEARESRSVLDRAGVRVIGTVVSGVKRRGGYYGRRRYGFRRRYGYHTAYGSHYAQDANPEPRS